MNPQRSVMRQGRQGRHGRLQVESAKPAKFSFFFLSSSAPSSHELRDFSRKISAAQLSYASSLLYAIWET